jgi:hypothetical protein
MMLKMCGFLQVNSRETTGEFRQGLSGRLDSANPVLAHRGMIMRCDVHKDCAITVT